MKKIAMLVAGMIVSVAAFADVGSKVTAKPETVKAPVIVKAPVAKVVKAPVAKKVMKHKKHKKAHKHHKMHKVGVKAAK